MLFPMRKSLWGELAAEFIGTMIILLFGFAIFKTWRNKKNIAFSLLFFLVTIFPVLQFLPVGQAIVAERYTYIPYLGLFIMIASLYGISDEDLKAISHYLSRLSN